MLSLTKLVARYYEEIALLKDSVVPFQVLLMGDCSVAVLQVLSIKALLEWRQGLAQILQS